MNAQAEFDFEARKEEAREASAAMIERIKKLLRLGADKRGNAHEAERAMQLAFELAEKFRVDVSGLDLDEESARLVHEHWPVGERYDRLRRGVFSVLRTYFHVTTCFCRPQMLIIGKPQDVLIARYVHDFLMRAGRECLRAFEREQKAQRRRMTPAKRSGYVAGFIYGVFAKLGEARKTMPLDDSQTALVVAEEAKRDALLGELVPKMTKMKALDGRRNKTAIMAGYHDGRATQIHQPLAGTPGATLLLQ